MFAPFAVFPLLSCSRFHCNVCLSFPSPPRCSTHEWHRRTFGGHSGDIVTTAIATSILIFRICSLPSIFFSQLDIPLWLRTVAIDKEPGISESKSSNLRFGFHGQPPTWNPPLPGAILIARKVGPSLPRWTFVLCTNVTPHGALLKRVHFTLHRVTTTCWIGGDGKVWVEVDGGVEKWKW